MGFTELFVTVKNKKHYEKIRNQVENIIANNESSDVNIYSAMKAKKDFIISLNYFGQNCGAVNIKEGNIFAWIGGDKDNLRQLKAKGFEVPPQLDDYLVGFLDENNKLKELNKMENDNFVFLKVKNGQILEFENSYKIEKPKNTNYSLKDDLMVELDEPLRVIGETESHYKANLIDDKSEQKGIEISKTSVKIEGEIDKFIVKMNLFEMEQFNIRAKKQNKAIKA